MEADALRDLIENTLGPAQKREAIMYPVEEHDCRCSGPVSRLGCRALPDMINLPHSDMPGLRDTVTGAADPGI